MLLLSNKEQQQTYALASFVMFVSADERVDMSEVQTHHCITPEH